MIIERKLAKKLQDRLKKIANPMIFYRGEYAPNKENLLHLQKIKNRLDRDR